MLESNNNSLSIVSRLERFHRSEEIECQVGKLVESKRLFLKRRVSCFQDYLNSANNNNYQSVCYDGSYDKTKASEFDAGSNEVSIINKSEIYTYNGTSWISAVLIMANCTIGIGLLNFPYAVLSSGGILPAMLTQMVILIFIIVSLTIMCHISQYYGDVTFQGVIGSHVGRIPKEICRIIIFINNFGALTVNLVVIGDQVEQIDKAIYGANENSHWFMNRKFLVFAISMVLILPLCFLKSFSIFKYTSFIGVVSAIYISFGLILTQYFKMGTSEFQPQKDIHSSHMLKIIPLICFSFECHIEIPPMVACLKKSTIWYYEKMIIGYVILSSIVYTTAGIFGYLTFGENTPDDILLAYNATDPLVIIAMIFLTLKIITTYPVIFYCLKIVVEDYFLQCFIKYEHVRSFESKLKILITLILFSTSLLAAMFIPDITSAINLIGGISAIFIFIFPGLCLMKLYSKKYTQWTWSMIILGFIYIVLGFFLLGVSTTQAIYQYIIG